MSACAHEGVGAVALVRRAFPGSRTFPARAEGEASRAQQAAKASRRLIPQFVSSVHPCGFRFCGVELEIRPEPGPEEREAILCGLEKLMVAQAGRPAAYGSAWRAAGIRENVEDSAEE